MSVMTKFGCPALRTPRTPHAPPMIPSISTNNKYSNIIAKKQFIFWKKAKKICILIFKNILNCNRFFFFKQAYTGLMPDAEADVIDNQELNYQFECPYRYYQAPPQVFEKPLKLFPFKI